jgi:hypothetical protein
MANFDRDAFNKQAQELLAKKEAEDNSADKTEKTEAEAVEAEDSYDNEPEVETVLEETDIDSESVDDGEEDASVEQDSGNKSIKPSKEQNAIIALKKKLKEAQEKLAEAEEAKALEQSASTKQAIANRYKDKGYDDEKASLMAERDYSLEVVQKKLAKIEFLSENQKVLEEFPEAASNIDKVMKNMKATGMSAEQICHAMFRVGNETPDRKRAIDAVTGRLPSKSADNANAGASRAERSEKSIVLSAAEMQNKATLEKIAGKKISNERFRELAGEYNL